MRRQRYIWVFGLIGTAFIIVATVLILAAPSTSASDDPSANVPLRPAHTDHSSLIKGPLETGPEVTQVCLSCHEDAAQQVMAFALKPA